MQKENVAMKDQMTKGVGKRLADGIKLGGQFVINHIRDGMVIDSRSVNNVITYAGLIEVAGQILNDQEGSYTSFDYIAIGTGTAAAEITTGGGARAAGTGTLVTTTHTEDTSQLVVTFNFTGTLAVVESMVGNNASANTGTMLCRQTFSVINVVSGDSLQVTWKVAVS